MNSGVHTVVKAMAEVSMAFRRVAKWLREQDGVVGATDHCWMTTVQRVDDDTWRFGVGPDAVVEWSADAEFEFGSALAYCMSVTSDRASLIVEASARAVGLQGEDILVELPMQKTMEDTESSEALGLMVQMADRLWELRDEVLREFVEWYEHGNGRVG